MAFTLSNVVLFNNKGELTTVQKNLLEVCMYALRIVCEAKSKPKIIFCQRDQSSNEPSAQQQILTELLRHLNEAGRTVGIKVEDVVDITREDLFLLTSAFTTTLGMNKKEVFYLNELFPQQIMKLRHYIILYFISQTSQIVSYTNMQEFYQDGQKYWNMILKNGQSVLELKSMIEQKIKLDLEQVGVKYVEKNYQDLRNSLQRTYEKNKNQDNFDIISQQFNFILQSFIERGQREFYEEVQSTKYGDNPTWKEQAMDEIISSYRYYKDQEEILYKKSHSKQKNESDLEKLKREIQDSIKQLIDRNQTKVEDFERMFKQLTKDKFKSDEVLLSIFQSEEQQRKILQKIYYSQTQETQLSKTRVKEGLFRVGVDELFEFILKHGEKNINLIMEQYGSSQLPQNISEILNPLIFGDKIFGYFNKLLNSSIEEEQKRRKLLTILKQFVSEIENSLLKENDQVSKIRDMNSIIQNTFSSIQNHRLEVEQNKLKPYLEKLGCFIIYKKQINTEKQEILLYQAQVQELIDEQRSICKDVFDDAINSSDKGKKAASILAKQLIEAFESREQSNLEMSIKERIYSQFPTPKQLNDKAYQISFRDQNFPNVIKYIVNIKSLIKELSKPVMDKSRDYINSNRSKFLNQITDIFKEVQNESDRWKDSLKEDQLNSFSEELKNNQILSLYSSSFSIEIYDKIATKTEFIDGFIKQFQNEQGQLPRISEEIVSKLIDYSDEEVRQKSINAQGCEARCPYCQNKCSENGNHPGNHKVIQHLPIGFRGYHYYKTKKMCYMRCIDKEMYDDNYLDDDPSYEKDKMVWIPLNEHIKKYHQDWRDSIPRQDQGNNDTEDVRKEVIIGWEGTKQYFLEKYKLLDEPRDDWNYIFQQSKKQRLKAPFDEYD